MKASTNRFFFASLALIASTITLGTNLDAQSTSASYTKNFGNSNLGGSIYGVTTTAKRPLPKTIGAVEFLPYDGRWAKELIADGTLKFNAKIFGKTHTLALVRGGVRNIDTYRRRMSTAQVNRLVSGYRNMPFLRGYARNLEKQLSATRTVWARRGCYASVQLGSRTVLNMPNRPSLELTKNFGPYKFISVKKTFTVGPVPVTVKGSVGVGAGLGLKAALQMSTLTASLTGTAKGFGHGTLSAGVDLWLASARVEAELEFAKVTLTTKGSIDTYGRQTREMTLDFTPIDLYLKLIAEAFGAEATLNLCRWTSRSYRISRT